MKCYRVQVVVVYFILFIYIIVEGVGPLPVPFLYSKFSSKNNLHISSVHPLNPYLVVELAVVWACSLFIVSQNCRSIGV